MSIKTCKDIPVGAIITSDKNNTYVCMVDDAGQRGFFTSKGTWYRASETGLAFGKNNTGKIAKIQIFDAMPPLDAHLYRRRPPCDCGKEGSCGRGSCRRRCASHHCDVSVSITDEQREGALAPSLSSYKGGKI